jgi:hypothetical protein
MAELRYEVVDDGFIMDSLTGEIVGTTADFRLTENLLTVEGRLVSSSIERIERTDDDPPTEDEIEAVLSRIGRHDAAANAASMRRKVANDQFRAAEGDAARRAWFLREWHGPRIRAFAMKAMQGQRSKTLALIEGAVSFRKTAGRTVIHNMDQAVAWFHTTGRSDRVKVEEHVTTADAVDAIRAAIASGALEGPPTWITLPEPTEVMTISTRVPVPSRPGSSASFASSGEPADSCEPGRPTPDRGTDGTKSPEPSPAAMTGPSPT